MSEGEQVGGPSGAVADDHRDGWSGCHVFQNGADGVGAALDDQADERGAEVA